LLAAAPAAFALQPAAIPMNGLRMMVSADSVDIESAERFDAAENAGMAVSAEAQQPVD
tara:strand:+ start:684 stop:857 length:174 start_codon:yes stop_codon:yes gene_type:complete